MGLHARYDPREDRMLLTLQAAADQSALSFWLTRRQWLAVLQQLIALVPDAPGAAAESLPPRPREQRAPRPAGEPVLAEAIRLQRSGDGLTLRFTGPQRSAGWSIPASALQQAKLMFVQQAERAGWDVEPALERLQAQSLAGELVRKARSS